MSTLTIYPDIETYVDSLNPTTNYGTNAEMAIGFNDTGGKGGSTTVKSYLQHDLSGEGITYDQVDSAFLWVRQNAHLGDMVVGYLWGRQPNSWDESTLTWNIQAAWSTTTPESDKLYLANETLGGSDYWKWTVTDLVKDALQLRSGLLNITGFHYGTDPGGLCQLWLNTSDSATPEFLVINYTVGGVTKRRVIPFV